MKWVETLDLRQWANKRDCQETLPKLIRKLIRATSNKITGIKFPSGDSISNSGWDGYLLSGDATEYIPSGISLWEFGSGVDVKGKADEDYEKRSLQKDDYEKSECTFIFVTPRLWSNANKWITSKNKEGIWKEIRVFDAISLEEWLENAPSVSAWLAIEHLNKFPSEGIQPIDDFWDEWSQGPKLKLDYSILICNRNKEKDALLASIQFPSLTCIQGVSRDESLAFVIAAFKGDLQNNEDLFARTLIVDNEDIFRKLIVLTSPLILIVRFETSSVIHKAISKGHCVIVPLGADASENWSNKIQLSPISREGFIDSLTKSGIAADVAEQYSRESARNINILRRQLEFDSSIPEWATPENAREILPALIVGRWNENHEDDKNIVARLAGETYETYAKKLVKWLNVADSPLVKFSNKWRLASPLDAWINISKFLTQSDFIILEESFFEIMSEIHPSLEIPSEKRFMAQILGKVPKFSDWIKDGITQSLILVSIYGTKLNFNIPVTGEIWVDNILNTLFKSDNLLFWKSIQGRLPLLAEASPTSFLDNLESQFFAEKSLLHNLFIEEIGFLMPHTYYTGMLWALENLAWMPEHFARATLMLANLASIDPGVTLRNKPINSLIEIFKPWHYQTNAAHNERIESLKLITKKQPNIGWMLLVKLLPEPHAIAYQTSKMRWRVFEETFEKAYTINEALKTYSSIVSILLELFDFSEEKLNDLIKISVDSNMDDRNKVLSFLEKNVTKINLTTYKSWNSIRGILSHHRSYPDADWSLPEKDLLRYEKLYKNLHPIDEIKSIQWMFEGDSFEFLEGVSHQLSFEEQNQLAASKRIEALDNVYKKIGLLQIIEIGATFQNAWIFGQTLACILNHDAEIYTVCSLLQDDLKNIRFIQGFTFRLEILKGIEFIKLLIIKLESENIPSFKVAELLVPVIESCDLWDVITLLNAETQKIYWQKMPATFWNLPTKEKIAGLNNLISVGRYFSALRICRLRPDDVPTDLIIEIMEKSATLQASEPATIRDYEVGILFKLLDNRLDFIKEKLVKLEWLFLPFLSSYNAGRSALFLHEELSKNPIFFIDVLKCIYKSDNGEEEISPAEMTEEKLHLRASNAHNLLRSWVQIPGMNEKHNVDEFFLKNWISQARFLAESCGRLKVADIYIGQVLAYYPEESKFWPSDEICKVMEEVNSEVLNKNFRNAIRNKRGPYSKVLNEGGAQERRLAQRFGTLANNQKNRFPIIANILENVAKSYLEQAKQEDLDAKMEDLEY